MWLLAGLSACSSPTGCGERGARDVLILGTLDEPASLDGLYIDRAGARELAQLIGRELLGRDDRGALFPELALELPSIATSSAGATVHWRIAPGARWADGHAIGVADVLRARAIEADPSAGTPGRPAPGLVGVEATGPGQFRARWRGAAELGPGTHRLAPDHVWASRGGARPPGLGREALANGPYRLAEWRAGELARFEPNPRWLRAAPAVPGVVVRFFRSEEGLVEALRAGEVDAVGEAGGLGAERALEAAAARPELAVESVDSGVWLQLTLRLDDPRLGDPRVREGLSLAIGRADLATAGYGGHARPTEGYFPPHHALFRDADGVARPGEAGRLLDEAGFPRRAEGVRSREGVALAFTLQFASDSAASERIALVLANQLRAVGVAIELDPRPLRVLFERMPRREHAPLVLYAWRLPLDWDASSIVESTGTRNFSGLRDAELDRLYAARRIEVDAGRRAERLQAIERRLAELRPVLPLLFRRSVTLRPRRLQGWRPTGTEIPVTWNAEAWTW